MMLKGPPAGFGPAPKAVSVSVSTVPLLVLRVAPNEFQVRSREQVFVVDEDGRVWEYKPATESWSRLPELREK